MASSIPQSTFSVPLLAGQSYWDQWFESIKLLATLTDTWEFLNPDLSDEKIRRLGPISQDGNKGKTVSSTDAEYGSYMKGLREVTIAIHNSIDEGITKLVLKEVNKEGKAVVGGIHIARRILMHLVKTYDSKKLEQADARQGQAAGESVPARGGRSGR